VWCRFPGVGGVLVCDLRLAEVAQLRADNQRIMTLLAPLASIPKLLASMPLQQGPSGLLSPHSSGVGAENGGYFSPSRIAGVGASSGGLPEPAVPPEELGSLKLWVGSWNLGAKVCANARRSAASATALWFLFLLLRIRFMN
jgi:hypothetical protein